MDNIGKKVLAKDFYDRLRAIAQVLPDDSSASILMLNACLNALFLAVSGQKEPTLPSMFARMTYLFQRYRVPGRLVHLAYMFRGKARVLQNGGTLTDIHEVAALGLTVASRLVHIFSGVPIDPDLKEQLKPENSFRDVLQPHRSGFEPIIKGLLTGLDATQGTLKVLREDWLGDPIEVQLPLALRDTPNFEHLQLPLPIVLLDVKTDENNGCLAGSFVLEPDYLFDVTALVDAVSSNNVLGSFVKRLQPKEVKLQLVVGNIVNDMLDKMLADPEISFEEIQKMIFRQAPLELGNLSNSEVLNLIEQLKKHYDNIGELIHYQLQQEGVDRDNCYLEPTFVSATYGIQGRLDVLHRPLDRKANKHIIELKSGSKFKPNEHNLNPGHYLQTILYRKLIESALGDSQVAAYIFYSKLDQDNLCYAPPSKPLFYEAMHARNQLIALEHRLMQWQQPDDHALMSLFDNVSYDLSNYYDAKSIDAFLNIWEELPTVYRKYFVSFVRLIAREQRLAKLGIEGDDRVSGFASLWRATISQKEEQYEILHSLVLQAHRGDATHIELSFSEHTPELANFRNGDIVVLYPQVSSLDEASALTDQLFKATIIHLQRDGLVVRLRHPVFNRELLNKKSRFWIIEKDLLDSSFTGLYRSLFTYLSAPEERRDLIMGIRPPQEVVPVRLLKSDETTDNQHRVIEHALAAQDYYLIWGPPGSGKTNVVLKNIIKHCYDNGETIAVLAYTNRAVDEICEAIVSIRDGMQNEFIRFGSRYATAETYRAQLFEVLLEEVESRADLKLLLNSCRIFVSTISSFQGKPELFSYNVFDRVIIDEASQVLEPQMVGTLAHFEKFILIGDHLQLPAVVQQDEAHTLTEDADLNLLGFNNLSNSYFERLFRLNLERQHLSVIGVLSEQGRMHQDVMRYPSAYFYKDNLTILPANTPGHQRQVQPLPPVGDLTPSWKQTVANYRVVFIETGEDFSTTTRKTHEPEAQWVVRLIRFFMELYQAQGLPFSMDKTIGVVTPYRAQIALIRNHLANEGIAADDLTVDTVERFQGSARDIIIISLCANSNAQVRQLVSLGADGVDRKFNVALTRARERVIVMGNPIYLSTQPTFNQYIEYCRTASEACVISGEVPD